MRDHPAVPLGEVEQLVLLAALRLGDGAYPVSVRDEIEARTGLDFLSVLPDDVENVLEAKRVGRVW